MTRLLLTDVTPLEDPAVYDELYGNASATRRAAADAFRFGKDRRLSIGASALLDRGLALFGLREKDMSYAFNPNGKPFFSNAPQLHFSISHSGSKVAVAFSDRKVGCDIEEVTDIDLRLAERFFSPREYEALMSVEGQEGRIREFFRIWTLKESYMKAVGLGLSLAPESFSVPVCVPGAGDRPSDSGFVFYTPDSFPGYESALCCRPESGRPEVIFLKNLL